MATRTRLRLQPAVSWAPSGAQHALTLSSLADDAGRAGPAHDFTDAAGRFPSRIAFTLRTRTPSAPAAGATLRLGFACAVDGVNHPGGLGAADAPISNVHLLAQLEPVLALPMDGSTQAQVFTGEFEPLAGRLAPVLWNDTGVALSSTPSDHELILAPLDVEHEEL